MTLAYACCKRTGAASHNWTRPRPKDSPSQCDPRCSFIRATRFHPTIVTSVRAEKTDDAERILIAVMFAGRHQRASWGIVMLRSALLIPIRPTALYVSIAHRLTEEGSPMNRREARSKRRGSVSPLEMLDDRVVLSVVAALPATPAPSASPFGAAHVGKFEHELERVDRGLKVHAKHLNSYVTNRVDYIQSVIASAAGRARVQAQAVSVASSTSSSNGAATRGAALNNRVDRLVASFNSSSSTPSASGSTLPANAVENNLLAARAGVTGGGSSGASGAGAHAIASSSGATNVIASPSTSGSTSTSSSTATGSSSTTSGTSSIGAIGARSSATRSRKTPARSTPPSTA